MRGGAERKELDLSMLRTRDLVGLQATRDVWDSRQDVKVPQLFGLDLRAKFSLGPKIGRVGLVAVVLALTATAWGCSSAPPKDAPTVPLSSTIRAQIELRAISASFAQANRKSRAELEPRIVTFQDHYPNDPLIPVSDVMLAWIALDRGDIDRATLRSSRAFAKTNGRGTTADHATVIQGAAMRRAGQFKAALDKLLPLRGKLIDAHARALLNEELTTSAIGAKRYGQAIDMMLDWLGESSVEERADIRSKLTSLVANIPTDDLLPILEKRREQEAEPQNEELAVQTTLVARLADSAIAKRDQTLASRLLGTSSALLGSRADAVASLAGGSGGEARVEAPTVGFVLSVRSQETRRRGAEVAQGIAHGLGLPGSDARLASRDDLGRVEGIDDALEALVTDGAAIIIAGIDREEATLAATFAARESVPVILLHPPAAAASSSPFVFVLGEDPERIRTTLASAIASHVPTSSKKRPAAPHVSPGQIVWVGDKGSVDMGQAEAFECTRLPPSWRGIGGVVVYGSCVSDVLLSVSGSSVQTAVGLDLGGVSLPKRTLAATAGVYPIDPRAITNPSLSSWMRAHADSPSIWAGLGRDAAVLAWSAVQVLPAKPTKDPKEVKSRHIKAAETLASAQADLWTTEAKGFGGERKMARQLGVRQIR